MRPGSDLDRDLGFDSLGRADLAMRMLLDDEIRDDDADPSRIGLALSLGGAVFFRRKCLTLLAGVPAHDRAAAAGETYACIRLIARCSAVQWSKVFAGGSVQNPWGLSE